MGKNSLSGNILYLRMEEALSRFGSRVKNTLFHPSERLKTFYALVIVGLLCFGYSWIINDMTVPLGGDYTLQEMTFIFNGYDDWHHFFETGEFPFWDRTPFLGIDNIGGNAFYYLFDPFFLILLPFPRDWLLYLQGFMFVPKLVLSGMLFYWYLSSFPLSDKNRRLGALCFGFCGYCFGYLWFHFIDSVAFLPLTFLGIERILQRKDPRILLVGFLLNAMTSYFFFVVFTIGAFLYAIFRFLQTMKEREAYEHWAVFGIGVFAFVIGIFLGAFTLLPGMYTAISMPRVSGGESWLSTVLSSQSLSELLDNLFTFSSTTEHNQITPLLNFLFMPDSCYYSNLLNVSWYDNLASSLYATTPLLLLFFVGLIDAFRSRRWSYLIGMAFILFLLFTPIGFYLFSGFTVAYARYFILPTSWMIVFDLLTLQRRRELPRSDLDLSFAFVMVLDALAAILVIFGVNENPSHFPSSTYWDLKMIEIPLSMAWVFVCYLVMRPLFHKKKLSKAMLALCAIDIAVMGNVTILFQGTVHPDSMAGGRGNIAEEEKIVTLLKESEGDDFYRLFSPTADRNNINISMRIGYNGLGSFHSVYAFAAQDFIDRSHIPYSSGNWSMGIHNRRENMETFLGTKYYLLPKVDLDYDRHSALTITDYDIPYGYRNILDLTAEEKEKLGIDYSEELLSFLASDACNKSLYVNMNFVDFAFAFDTVINTAWLSAGTYADGSYYWGRYEDINEYPLLRFAMLDDADYETFARQGKYNAGTYTMNGKEYDIPLTSQNGAATFYNSLVTTDYVPGDSDPIEHYYSSRIDVEVFSANWPATASVPSGEYAYMNPLDPYDREGEEEWNQEHPLYAMNGIGKADTKYDFDTKRDDEGQTSDTYTDEVLYNSKLYLTFKKNNKQVLLVPEADPSDPSTGAYISIDSSNNISWRFFDENDNLICIAQHSYSDYQKARGYYVDRPVKTIVGVIMEGNKDTPCKIDRPEIYIIRNKDYQDAIDKLQEEPIEILSRGENSVLFTTDYSKDKFVVLNYPRQDGWTLYEHGEDKEGNPTKTEIVTYKAQGGFIGFEAEEGEHTYSLEYKSPWFTIGMLFTGIGLLVTLLSLYGFGILAKKEKFRREQLDRLRYQAKQDQNRLILSYQDCEDR